MRNRGTVPAELSLSEARELHIAVLQQLPEVAPDKARYFIRHKKELGKLLRQVFADAKESVSGCLAEWEQFYLKYFGMEVDLSAVRIPDDPGGFVRVLVIAQGLTLNKAFDVCKSKFPSWKYAEDLDCDVPQSERNPNPPAGGGTYAIRVRDRVEADEELADRSAEWVKTQNLATETLLERLVHELKFFDETGRHLDVENWTLCSGSRRSVGPVPRVYWSVGKFQVDWDSSQDADPSLRARAAVS